MRMMLMYSDNPAYNVLIDAVGFEAINETLHELGMKQSRITRRLLWCTGEQLKQHPAIKLHPTDAKFRKPANAGELNYPANFKDSIVGRAHVGAGGIAMTGLNFGAHNYLKLSNLHELITDITTGNKVRRMLGNAKWQRLVHLIAAIPEEAGDAGTPVDITKRLYFGQGNPQKDFKRIRSFNIIGEAYGFMTESAYLIDTETGAEVVISARGHFNRNQVIGDDLYEYATEGYPLFRFLGEYFLEEAQKYSSSRWKTKHLPGFLSERLSKGFSRN
jgi:hypothetical protein